MLLDNQDNLKRIINNLEKLNLNKKLLSANYINGLFSLFNCLWKKSNSLGFPILKLIVRKFSSKFAED